MVRPVALPTITNDSALGGTVIEKSVRFHDADGAHFRRDASSTGNRRTFTFSCWVKRMDLGAYHSMLGGKEDGTNNVDYFLWWTDDTLCFTNYNSSNYKVRTAVKYRDSNSWYHLVLAVDSTQGTQSNRVKVYINGVDILFIFYDVTNKKTLEEAGEIMDGINDMKEKFRTILVGNKDGLVSIITC